jgi:hypothetical protein
MRALVDQHPEYSTRMGAQVSSDVGAPAMKTRSFRIVSQTMSFRYGCGLNRLNKESHSISVVYLKFQLATVFYPNFSLISLMSIS